MVAVDASQEQVAAARPRGLRFADFDPWYYPTAAEYRQALEGAGFSVDTIETFALPTRLRFHATKPAVGARP